MTGAGPDTDRAGAIKICGLKDAAAIDAAIRAGASHLGFVHFGPSPRHVDHTDLARLAATLPADGPDAPLTRVLLTVDADWPVLDAAVDALAPGLLQLHGHETPERIAAVRARYGLPVIKAAGIADAADIMALRPMAARADLLLLDARPPVDADRPGGLGRSFDWDLLAGPDFTAATAGRPWWLAGGLTPATVADAIIRTRADGVDVSSGVETAPGVKDPAAITAFVAAARAAFARRPEAPGAVTRGTGLSGSD